LGQLLLQIQLLLEVQQQMLWQVVLLQVRVLPQVLLQMLLLQVLLLHTQMAGRAFVQLT
jgi:hypothetical protein